MERSSLKLLAPALFVVLLLSSMGEVLGTRTGILKEVTEEKYSMREVAEILAEASAVVMAAANNGNVNLKNALLPAEAMQCAGDGSYCNVQFGPLCCPGIGCFSAPYIGGVCRKV